jgi:hypothetical protein
VIRITDKAFRYTPSYNTDLTKTFKKIEQAVRTAANQNMANAAKAKSAIADHRVARLAKVLKSGRAHSG